MDPALPKLRPIEAFPVEVDGRRLVYLHDPLRYAADSLLVAYPAFFILTLLDGTRSVVDVQAAFAERFGSVLTGDEIAELLQTLDRHYFLVSESFRAREAEVAATFRAAPLRPAAHAGTSYPDDPAALRLHLDGFFADRAPPERRLPVHGLIAPHIDLRVGGAVYGCAYGALRDTAAERFVILGTAHYPGTTLFAATRKDFATPLGPVTTDRAFLARLAAGTPHDLFVDEMLHRTEHAVEFQVVMLKHVLGARSFTIVPILVTSFHGLVAARRSPRDDARVAGFVAALREALADDPRPTVVIAGVDFAHVGTKFGDREGLAPELLAATEAKDRRLIATLEAGDAEGFFAAAAADGDRTRICGLSAMYTFLSCMDGVRGRLLHYDRTRDEGTGSSVSYAALAFGEARPS